MLSFQVLSFIDDPKTLARAEQVSTRWRDLLNDDMAWKILCEKHAYRRAAEDIWEPGDHFSFAPSPEPFTLPQPSRSRISHDSIFQNSYKSAPDLVATSSVGERRGSTQSWRPSKATSYRSHFKRKYMVEAAWRKGGKVSLKHVTPEPGVVTSLHLTPKYIVVAMDNAKIHVFNTNGEHQKLLKGHVMGVWAMVPWDDLLVSGGCDRDVRVWNMVTGLVVSPVNRGLCMWSSNP